MEMGSVVGLEDVNFPTEPKTPTPIMIFPKIEPKLEPLDEFTPQSTNPISNFSYNFNSSSGFSNSTPQQQLNATSSQTPSSNETGVHSEYNRISELFRTVFAQRLQRHGDVEAFEDPDCRAIVPVSNDSQVSDIVIASTKYDKRSSELVRVTDLKPEDERYFRDLIRKTRMLYDSLRIFVNLEDENNQHLGPGRQTRARGDLKASQMMREYGLWLNRDKRTVGAIPGVIVGDLFLYRMELCVVGLQGTPQAGIANLPANQSSNGEPIATSVIASGGYEDDEDAGDVIIYKGKVDRIRILGKLCIKSWKVGIWHWRGTCTMELSLIYPSHFAERWAEWGDMSRIDSNYVRPAYPSIPPLDFAMDVSRMRNLACYMSHSSSPNVLVQPVLYDHNNVSFPHLMLFAMENIPPLRELSIDYGMADDCTGKLAICN